MHYAKAGLRGFFSLTKRIEQQVKARARVEYIALDGTRSSPELARDLIGTYRIAALEDSLETALKCKGKAS